MDFVLNSKNLLLKFEEYLAIGFDVDHCLTRYKIKNLSQLIYHSSIEILQSEFNYPQETFQNSSKHQILNFGMSYLAIDVVYLFSVKYFK